MEKRLLPRAAGPSTLSTSSTVKKSENIKNYLTMESMEKRFFKANAPLHLSRLPRKPSSSLLGFNTRSVGLPFNWDALHALHGEKNLKKNYHVEHGGHGREYAAL